MGFVKKIKLMFKYIVDKEVPFREKLWLILPAIYIISPIDLIPFPVLGFSLIDDLVVLVFTLYMLNSKVKKYYNDDNDESCKKTKRKFNIKNVVEVDDYEVKDDDDN